MTVISCLRLIKDNHGFTLIEIIMALLILAIAIVPMLNAYNPGLFSTANEEEVTVFTNRARSTLNRVSVLDFKSLYTLVQTNQANPVNLSNLFGSADEAAKETFSLKGTNYTPIVVMTDFSDVGEQKVGGLIEIIVTVKQINLKTLKAEY